MDVDLSSVPSELALSLAQKCQRWAYIAYSADADISEAPRNPHIDKQYDTRLDRAVTDIQSKIQSQRRALDELRTKYQDEEEKQKTSIQNMNPETKRLYDLATQSLQLQAMTKAQNYLLHIVSQIPSSESPLNALLTRQNVESVNEQTAQTISQVKENIADVNARTARERATLQETLEISAALKERLASLRTKSQQSASHELSHRKTQYTTSTKTLTTSLQSFIRQHLSAILYAESQGALPAEPKSLPKNKRRRDDDDKDDPERDLARRMGALVEELMNRLVATDRTSPWVDVPEDDVIVRCLVRANIAMLHPNDGSKIRLIEFHKEVEGGEMDED